jgi:hypothetical protein
LTKMESLLSGKYPVVSPSASLTQTKVSKGWKRWVLVHYSHILLLW